MANPGIPTTLSHGPAFSDLLPQASALFQQLYSNCNAKRIAMAAGAVSDEIILDLWIFLANAESRLLEYRKAPNFHDEYARWRGLSYRFNCTGDVNAATDRIINLPDNHKFKLDHRVEFIVQDGALPGGLSPATNYWLRDIQTNAVGIGATEGAASNINLTNGTGTAELLQNFRPDYASLLTAVDAALDEIELNLTQRAPTYVRANLDLSYSTRDTTATATLRTKLQDIEDLIDAVAA